MIGHPGPRPTPTTMPGATVRGLSCRPRSDHRGSTAVPATGHLTGGQYLQPAAGHGRPSGPDHSTSGQPQPVWLLAWAGGTGRAGR
jgi:hypothetical protein